MGLPKPVIPREHGAWAILLLPLMLGAVIAGRFTPAVLVLLASALFVFLSYTPARVLSRHLTDQRQAPGRLRQAAWWTALYLIPGIAGCVWLLAHGHHALLLPGALAMASFLAALFASCSMPKSIAGDLFSVVGLSLGAPAAYAVASGVLDRTAWLSYLMIVLFFGSSVFYVRMKINAIAVRRESLTWREKWALGKPNILYQSVVIGIVVALAFVQWSPRLVPLAFVPMIVHAFLGTIFLSRRVKLTTLGSLLVAQSVAFGALLVMVS
jgi:hypothetical protein